MAKFSELIVLTIGDLEDNLGADQFRRFVARSEQRFVDQVTHVADYILSNPSIRAIFVSGPTSSGKNNVIQIDGGAPDKGRTSDVASRNG